jgi:16S rRNA (cytidine1402-2'-O)-methyltransferase
VQLFKGKLFRTFPVVEQSVLYVVATPIGNLADISPRAREILSRVDFIAAEDTRHTGKLLQLLDIKAKRMVSYHDHNEERRAREIIDWMSERPIEGALVSDAGTPCIADPGYRIVQLARKAGIKVSPVPGPSSPIALLSVAGLPSSRFMFVGFLPAKDGAMRSEVASWASVRCPVVFFESGPRILKTLAAIDEIKPGVSLVIGRELTKIYEEVISGTCREIVEHFSQGERVKGELVCVLLPPATEESTPEALAANREQIRIEAADAFADGASHKDLKERFADRGLSKKELYELLLELKGKHS